MRFSDLSLFATSGGFGDSGGFGPACGFDAFRGGGACCFFGLAESTSHGGVGVFCLVGASRLCCLTSSGVSGRCCSFRFCLSE